MSTNFRLGKATLSTGFLYHIRLRYLLARVLSVLPLVSEDFLRTMEKDSESNLKSLPTFNRWALNCGGTERAEHSVAQSIIKEAALAAYHCTDLRLGIFVGFADG